MQQHYRCSSTCDGVPWQIRSRCRLGILQKVFNQDDRKLLHDCAVDIYPGGGKRRVKKRRCLQEKERVGEKARGRERKRKRRASEDRERE